MNDRDFAKSLARATGQRSSLTVIDLRAAETELEKIATSKASNRVWAAKLLKEARWRLAVRHAEATDKRTHFGWQEVWRDDGDLSPFCGVTRAGRRDGQRVKHRLTLDPLEVTCVKCWRRLAAEAQERIAGFEVARALAEVEDTQEREASQERAQRARRRSK